jgi:signal transduction histidine kinase/DNA-binding response OmpR family regulator
MQPAADTLTSGSLSAGRRHTSSKLSGSHVSVFLHSLIAISMLAVLIADLFTPLGIVVWVIYLVPVSLSLGLWRPQAPLWIATASTILMVFTFMTDEAGVARHVAQMNRGFGIATIWIVAIVGWFFITNRLTVARQQWLQSGRTQLTAVMGGEQPPEQFGQSVLGYLAELLGAHAGAMFIEDEERFRRVATYGVPTDAAIAKSFSAGDGLLGQAARDGRTLVVNNVPEGYLRIGSALGGATPRCLIIAPTMADQKVNAVLEFGFFQQAGSHVLELLAEVSEAVGVAVRSANYRLHLQNLLEQTQRQAEELQVQSEELRVSNEELEVQSRALQDSQTRLEQQQVDLEQSNSQLEEQTQLLEAQRDDLTKARTSLENKAKELELASRYKSSFLANMSHELRTPLNSSLILARLLADNPQGNLTADQVTSAQTILSSGNDLLALINDILDLSKIEAGRMDVQPETLWLTQLVSDLKASLGPIAQQKGLSLNAALLKDCPETIDTDRRRLEQVLKNLISNAIKFTDTGSVSLQVAPVAGDRIAFKVSDTGIGIPADQRQAIFEAFRQIDSAANRKYSGTGLGLSISRELTRLLGGDITVESQPEHGAAFTVTLPLVYQASRSASPGQATIQTPNDENPAHLQRISALADTQPPAVPSSPRISRRSRDDREQLVGNRRSILVVEDDESFARILYDLAHEHDFQCLIANSGEEALVVATQYMPSAVVLDIGLPDQSGLSVLDRLKQDSRTRHIPVHVVSANDYTETALSLGAVGYMLKPVTRETLIETFKGLETRLVQRLRRVLVVEDDPVQLESLRKLLGSHDVETTGARTAAECLEWLKVTTFDCMVLDLTLPDASGYSLLETLSQEDAYSFPPVIVYTGRDLSSEEEIKLRRYSRSIIIKGAKSPERLLDEVTLFLHQVVAELPAEHQRMIQQARSREAALEGRRILVVEDDVRNVFALTSIFEPRGVIIQIARNGREAVAALDASIEDPAAKIDLVLMDVMMPEMDGLAATREIRLRREFAKLPIIMLTAKAMKDDQENCIAAGANDYMAKPLDVDKLLSLVRVWIRS